MNTTTTTLTATCDRIRSLAGDLDIDLRVIESAHPAHRDAVLVHVHIDDVDRFEELLILGPYEFGCSWPRSDRDSLRSVFLPPEYVTRTVPRGDLPQLLACFETETARIRAEGPRAARRRKWVLTGIFFAVAASTVLAVRAGQYDLVALGAVVAWVADDRAAAAEARLVVVDRLTSGQVPA